MRMTDWFIIFFFFTRLGLFLAERAFFFSTAFVESRKTARFRNRNLSVFLSFLFIPPFSRPETSQQVTPCSSSSAFLSSFHGIARPLSILQRAFFLGDSPEERSENRIFLSIEFAPLLIFGSLMGPNILNRHALYIYITRICKYIYIYRCR